MRKRQRRPSSCEWQNDTLKRTAQENRTVLYKYLDNGSWRGIRAERYKSSGTHWADIVRKTIIGSIGKSTKFHLRYFEIAPGGYSSLEFHRHEHVVIGIRGRGTCTVYDKKYTIQFLDTLYIAPRAPHQLQNPFDEPFGFFCIVDAKRDVPTLIK